MSLSSTQLPYALIAVSTKSSERFQRGYRRYRVAASSAGQAACADLFIFPRAIVRLLFHLLDDINAGSTATRINQHLSDYRMARLSAWIL